MLAYAQKRIRLLEDTLEQREKQERQLVEDALRKQHSEDEKLADMRLKHELEKLKTELNDLMQQKVGGDCGPVKLVLSDPVSTGYLLVRSQFPNPR